MQVRLALASDWPDLAALDSYARHDPTRSEHIRAWIEGGYCHLVGDAGTALGYAVLTPHFFDRPFIDLVMIDPAHRGKGLGAMLIRHLCQLVGGAELWTSTNQSNTAMRHLLAKAGFVQRGQIDLDAGDPELVYCRQADR